jgi:hypothetical protein
LKTDLGRRVPRIYKQAKWKGRLYCCIQLACSPLTTLFKIGKRVSVIALLAAMLMNMITINTGEIFRKSVCLKIEIKA